MHKDRPYKQILLLLINGKNMSSKGFIKMYRITLSGHVTSGRVWAMEKNYKKIRTMQERDKQQYLD
jgi:hypothetical protein